MQITLRNYKDSDFEAVKKNIVDGGIFDPVRDTRENLKKKIEYDPESIIIAEKDGELIGNVFFFEDGWAAHLFRLVVREDYRGKGVAQMLMQEAEKRLRERGIKQQIMFVNEKSPHLIEHYKKQGYNSIGSYRFMRKVFDGDIN